MSGAALFVTAGIGCLIAGLALWEAARRFRGVAVKAGLGLLGTLLIGAGCFLVVAVNPWIADPQYRAYKRLYWDIDNGMTRAEVLKAVARRYPPGSRRTAPQLVQDDPVSMMFFMGVEGSQGPNCEGIFVKMEDGLVVSKHYSPD